VASVWIPGRVSESKGNASEYREDRVKVVVIAGVVVDGVPLYNIIFETFHRYFVNIYRYGFKVSSKKWRLEINEFRSYCDVHIR